MHAHTCTHTPACTHTRTDIRAHTHTMYTCTLHPHAHTCTHIPACTHAHTAHMHGHTPCTHALAHQYVHTHALHTCMHTCMHTSTHACTHTWMHTGTHCIHCSHAHTPHTHMRSPCPGSGSRGAWPLAGWSSQGVRMEAGPVLSVHKRTLGPSLSSPCPPHPCPVPCGQLRSELPEAGSGCSLPGGEDVPVTDRTM